MARSPGAKGGPKVRVQGPCVDSQEVNVDGGSAHAVERHRGSADEGVADFSLAQDADDVSEEAHSRSPSMTWDADPFLGGQTAGRVLTHNDISCDCCA